MITLRCWKREWCSPSRPIGLRPTAGEVFVGGKAVSGINRAVGYVTQDDNLLPWRGLLGNVELPLELRGIPTNERRRRARELLQRVNLEAFESHFPHELSGGMRQRANIVRALIYDPSLIVMDEPFGSIDEQTRRIMQEELLRIWEGQRKTVLFVTHSMEEAVFLADRIVLMSPRPGRIQEIIEVPLPRPRGRDTERSPEFTEVKEILWDKLKVMQTV